VRVRQGLAGRGDGYQFGLDWGRSSTTNDNKDQLLSLTNPRDALHHGERVANK